MRHCETMKVHLENDAKAKGSVAAAAKSENLQIRTMATSMQSAHKQLASVDQKLNLLLAMSVTGGGGLAPQHVMPVHSVNALAAKAKALLPAELLPSGVAEQQPSLLDAATQPLQVPTYVPSDLSTFDKSGGVYSLWHVPPYPHLIERLVNVNCFPQ